MGKKFRICLEIKGLGTDENGEPCNGGLCFVFGDDKAEELTGAEYDEFLQKIKIGELLRLAFLDEYFSTEDCRLISPEEYDRKYETV